MERRSALNHAPPVVLALILLGMLASEVLTGSGTDLSEAEAALDAALALCPVCWSAPPVALVRFAEEMHLTTRELQVARCASIGTGNQQIAHHLGISRRTVETHLRRIYTRLEIHNRTRLAHVLATAAHAFDS
jgi:DNA-binding NarL/FixJ family response regulator